MKTTTRKWDASEYLDSPEMIKEYLNAALEDGDAEMIQTALGDIAKAKGMTEIANKTNLSRQSLYKSLSSNGSPKFETIQKVVEALGCKLAVV